MRQLGGGLLMLIGIPLTLVVTPLVFAGLRGFSDVWFLLPGPALLAIGLWAAFPRHAPRPKLTINDDTITIEARQRVIPLKALSQIKLSRPVLSKHDRLTFSTADEEIPFDVFNLSHEARDIINLIGIRLEKKGKYLKQGRSDVLGALTGVWAVQTGVAFEMEPDSAMMKNGRE